MPGNDAREEELEDSVSRRAAASGPNNKDDEDDDDVLRAAPFAIAPVDPSDRLQPSVGRGNVDLQSPPVACSNRVDGGGVRKISELDDDIGEGVNQTGSDWNE